VAFSAPTQAWFDAAFDAPTPAQSQGWEAIQRGDHTLILAPTGSGKTLAAFLWAIDRLVTSGGQEGTCRVLYVSPLKALTYDVERNLRSPLAGIAREAGRLGVDVPEIRVATRTGDTPAEDRRAMARRPPDILITTPESLYLLLTSKAASMLATVEHVIIDEIHSVAATKRGVHLALSLERLAALAERPVQRIGLSATQRPLDVLAHFLGGQERGADGRLAPRPVAIVDAGIRKPLDLQIVVPVEDMADLRRPAGGRDLDGEGGDSEDLIMRGAAAGTPEVRASIWPSIYPALLELIRSHRSTLIFVNSRRLAERLSARLNELAAETPALGAGERPTSDWSTSDGPTTDYRGLTVDGPHGVAAGAPADLVRAHHGSIAREQRLEIEDALKAGRLPALVATSSLELGIDMGAIDLVIQIEAPTSVASGLQRIGRAGHHVGEPSRGRIFPKYRHDLLVAAVVAERMHAGQVEETRVPRNPLDVLAQQIVAMVAVADGPVPTDDVAAVVRGAYPYAELGTEVFEGVLDMLSGRYPSDEFADLRPRLVWDRLAGTLTPRAGARMLAVTSGGTIPDRGLFGVFTPDGGRVGELDEEMVYESRVGETFLLGATTWRIEDITRDRVVVTPAPGVPGKMPFWHGDTLGRPFELGVAVGAFTRTLSSRSDDDLAAGCDLDPLAVRNLRAYVEEEMEATGGLLPTDRQIVVERFRDELGDWRLAVLSPFGARVHAPWAMAIEAKVRERLDIEVSSVWSDDGIILRLPEADEPPDASLALINPDEVEELVVAATGDSALFASRFRENAARALLLPRRRPGARTPLWQLRQRAADLLAVASRYGEFPILLETYRECLRDAFDLPALVGLLRDVASRKVRVTSVEVSMPSPFANGLASAYVAAFMYDGDAPLAERRAQALTLDRRMLAELLGSDELRDLLDAGVIDAIEVELQALDERRQATSIDGVADLLRRLGDLTADEVVVRSASGLAVAALVELVAARRAVALRVAGEQRYVLVEDAARYRDALGVSLPSGLPDALLAPVTDPVVQLVRRWARVHGPFKPTQVAERFDLSIADVAAVLGRLVGDGRIERGAFIPGGSGDEWCDTDVLRLVRQRSLAALRKEVEAAEPETLARFLPAWQGVAALGVQPPAGGLDRLYEVVGQIQGVPIPASVLEHDVLSARVRDYTPRLLDELLAAGDVLWIGAGAIGRSDGRVVLAQRDQAALLLRRLGYGPAGALSQSPAGALSQSPAGALSQSPAGAAIAGEPAPTDSEVHHHLRAVLAARGACFFRELGLPGVGDIDVLEALWDLVWAGEVTGDAFAAMRATTGSARAAGRARRPGRGAPFGSSLAPALATATAGRSPFAARSRPRLGSLTALGPPRGQGRWSLVARELQVAGRGEPSPTEAGIAVAGLLLERHGILTREAARGESLPGGFAGIYPVLRTMEEAGRLRRGYFVTGMGGAQFALPGAVDRLRSLREGPGSGWPGAGSDLAVHVLAATDPANAYGLSLPWPIKGPSRTAGAYVILMAGTASLYLERGGRGLLALRDLDGTWETAAVAGLGWLLERGRVSKLALQRYPEGLVEALQAAGFVPTPKGLVRHA
jgi:ATP-dependent Lhr-like helicase